MIDLQPTSMPGVIPVGGRLFRCGDCSRQPGVLPRC